jgi:hypothetical protein
MRSREVSDGKEFKKITVYARIKFLKAVNMKTVVFWYVVSCVVSDISEELVVFKMPAVSPSKISVTIYQTTRHHTPYNSNFSMKCLKCTCISNIERMLDEYTHS